MNKQEIKDKIKKQLECDDDTAERIFHRALEDKMITVRLNWNFIIGLVIYSMVLLTAIWAIWRHIG
jgi:hypothetical protein|tara:strand:- start:193 stop:390 length:198 start_codon:yes stop_codon:yes gene_type:complete